MEQETQTQEAPAQVGLTIQDLRILAGSVELSSQRGAFRASEMEIIGATYNKLAGFLKSITPAEAPAGSEEATTETEAEVEVTASE